jgi:predicted  nucleic acid-binding Zn-ribbon protein
MDASTIGLITTSLLSVIAALAAAYNTVRKQEIATLKGVIAALEKRVADLETDLEAERVAHKATRAERDAAEDKLRRALRTRKPATGVA